jgi:MarR family
MRHYSNSRWLAIAAGIAATGGALAILLADPLTTGEWRLDHGLLPVIVAITIAAGHLAKSALIDRKIGSSLGFAIIFSFGTLLTVYSSVGSQKAATGDKAGTVDTHNRAVADKTAELASARKRHTEATNEADREMKGHDCGTRCTNWRKRAAEVHSHIRILEAELRQLGTVKTARPKAEAAAEALALFGFDRAAVAQSATILEPFAYSLLLELSAIVAFGYGFGHGGSPATALVAGTARSAGKNGATEGNPQPPRPGNRQLATKSVATRAAAEADVIRLVARGEELPSQDDLARRWNVHKGTVSKWVADFERRGLIARQWDGRCNRVVAA